MKNSGTEKGKIVGSILGTLVFIAFMIVFDKYTDPESFNKENYWRKIIFMGILMFVVYYFLGRYKDLTWKDLFHKIKK